MDIIDISKFRFKRTKQLFELANLAGHHADLLAEKYAHDADQAPLTALNMSFNYFVHAAEIFDFYHHRWFVPGTPFILSSEMVERESLVLRSMIIETLSAFEYGAKQAVKSAGSPFTFNGRVYLGNIMAKSHEIGITSAAQDAFWDFIREWRNAGVHNNGVGERWKTLTLSSGAQLSIYENAMATWRTSEAITLTRDCIEHFASWCDGFLSRRQRP
ncbi:hypothetical protein N6H05_01895 [Sphingobium sp. WTD-1]|uniref:hypothetical protein n=1 Tax=Sphingobium sp. WTD-1 TaxID=2979467 RepID=UPI0024DE3F73|nr:hypothetical protein [Sphingobium sp. WTD-1]WIA56603.1 hypothetical protein N6H05_01895 [Sphingobium sp. WTD-1]